MDEDTPQFDIHLLFEEIGVVLDDHQYRDAISLVDMYHVYLRQRQVIWRTVVIQTHISRFLFGSMENIAHWKMRSLPM